MEKRPVADDRKEESGSWRRDKQNDQNIDAMNDKMQSVEIPSSHVIDNDFETEKSKGGFKAWKPKSLREEMTMENERSPTDRATSSSSLKSGRSDNSLRGRENERPESPRVWGRNNRKMDEAEGGGNDPQRMRENERPES